MIRTLWLALIGLASLGVLVGIKMGAAPLAGADMSRVEATTAEQVTSTKADKLEVSNIGPTLDKTVVTPITIMPPKTKSEQTEATTKIVSQHWHDPLAPKSKARCGSIKRQVFETSSISITRRHAWFPQLLPADQTFRRNLDEHNGFPA